EDQDALVADAAVLQALSWFEPEIDQAELARWSSFVNACRWNAFDSWVVHLELGKLSFRRRRYHEADAHFKKAAARGPATARFTVLSLRFANLSWLNERSPYRDLPNDPETIECAYEALESAGGGEDTASIRVWLAARTRE